MKKNIKNVSIEELLEYFESKGEKRFRAKQLFDAIYSNKITDFDAITNFSNELKTQLKTDFYIHSLKLEKIMTSVDGTTKFVFETLDNNYIESVFLPNNNNKNSDERNTLCISTMIGCPIGCKFCASGKLNYVRNLDIAEILDQILYIQNHFKKIKITNVVFMGIGEPFLNYDNVVGAIRLILKYGWLNRQGITISTIGIPNAIIDFANTELKIKLALSLHFPDDNVRDNYIPISKKYNIEKVLKSLDYYYQQTRLPITIEYIPFRELNDSDKDVIKLIKIARRFPSVVNLIPYNNVNEELIPCNEEEINAFAKKLYDSNIMAITRKSQGQDIFAACGMLAYQKQENIL